MTFPWKALHGRAYTYEMLLQWYFYIYSMENPYNNLSAWFDDPAL